ncbi:MAG TPA: transcription antitermination factor NusB [Chloroflexota bacterium]
MVADGAPENVEDPEAQRTSKPGPRRAGAHRARRLARVAAFQTLYEVDVARHSPVAVLDRLAEAERLAPETVDYARELVAGVLRHRSTIDDLIRRAAPLWPLEQLSPVERNLLRLGIFETLYMRDRVPIKAAINEAVELAKLFGTDTTPRFVNGVLGRIVAEEIPEEKDGVSQGEAGHLEVPPP